MRTPYQMERRGEAKFHDQNYRVSRFSPQLLAEYGPNSAPDAFRGFPPPLAERACREVEQAVRDALADHGQIKCLRQPRRDAAVHEAGHCVVFAAFGHAVQATRIFQFLLGAGMRNRYWGGWTDADGLGFLTCARLTVLEAMNKLGGITAEQIMIEHPSPLSSLDEVVAARLLCEAAAAQAGSGELGVQVYASTQATVLGLLDRHRAIIESIARLLMQKRRIGKKQLDKLLADVVVCPDELVDSVAKSANIRLIVDER